MTDEPGRSAGWRWESYGGVEVRVPDDWEHGTTGYPPCLLTDDVAQPRRGYVGRPGAVPAVDCDSPVPPPGKRRDYLWFGSGAEAGLRTYDAGWAEQSRILGGIALTVFSDDAAVRAGILDSARLAAGDGCPVEHAVLDGPDARPDPGPGGLAALGPAESITLCRYALGDAVRPSPASPVLSRSELVGEQARAVVRAILAAPAGEGPNEPGNRLPEYAHGDQVLLLTVSDGTRVQEVFVRYSGSLGNGIDDGHTHRRLTTESLTLLLSGPHQPTILQGSVADLAWP